MLSHTENLAVLHTMLFYFMQANQGKGSKLSETWGKVKDKLAPRDSIHTPLSSKPSRRARANTGKYSRGGTTSPFRNASYFILMIN